MTLKYTNIITSYNSPPEQIRKKLNFNPNRKYTELHTQRL